MWFWLSLIALLCWSGSDLFSKIGCRDAGEPVILGTCPRICA